ncbi:MAG: alpha/beta fold hydrolase, partial [Candidatus Bipolaricaulota bacterium]|nr:alpha/beta fold hydrolase [Candidatus Bipolaricaulota bacterium]
APIAARVNDLSGKVKEQADALADIDALGARVSKLETEAPPTTQSTTTPATQPVAPPPAQPEPQPAVEPATAEAQPQTPAQPIAQPAEPATALQPSTEAAVEPAPQSVLPEIAAEPKPSSTEPGVAAAATGERVDEGRFLVLQTGTPVGIETFELRRSGDGYTLASSIQRSEGPLGTELSQALTLDANLQPTAYRLTGTVNGAAQDVTADLREGRVVLVDAGIRIIEESVQTGPAVVTFDGTSPSSYVLMHRALGAAIDKVVVERTILRATQRDLLPLRIGPAVPVTVSVSGQKDLGYEHRVQFGTEADVAYYYVQNGIVIAVAVPSQALFAYRQDLFPKGLSLAKRTLVEMAAPVGIAEIETKSGGTLNGTFTVPSAAEKMPAVLLLPDLGPFDRNGDAVGLETRILRDLARRLGQQGIASFRYDLRGTGASGGDYSSLTLAELETDALIALITLSNEPRIDKTKVFVVGFGYGGLLAQRLVARSSFASGAISIATPARSLAESWVEQVRKRAEVDGLPSADVQILVEREQSFLRFARSTQGTWADVGLEAAREALPWMNEVEYARRSQFFPLPLLRDVLDEDPVDAARAVQKRTLFVQGDTDFVVPAADAELFVQAAQAAGNQEATPAVVKGVNHWLRAHPESAASLNGHLEAEMDWSVVAAILSWVTPTPIPPSGSPTGPSPAS